MQFRTVRHLSVAVVTAIVVAGLGVVSGILVRPAAACDSYAVSYGPISVDAYVQQNFATSSYQGTAETDTIWFGSPCTGYHQFSTSGTLHAQYNYNQHVYWDLSLPSGVSISGVTLGPDEWIAAGGNGNNYVVIGQFTPTWGGYTSDNPSVVASIPSSLWGRTYTISMYMAYNSWTNCNPLLGGECGGTEYYNLVG